MSRSPAPKHVGKGASVLGALIGGFATGAAVAFLLWQLV
jgi:hypothetical protein